MADYGCYPGRSEWLEGHRMKNWKARVLAGGLLSGLAACAGAENTWAFRLANPAAVFCTESGGKYEIRDGADGQVGICILPDGVEVDAWEYFRAQNGE